LGWSATIDGDYNYYYDGYIETYDPQGGVIGALESPLDLPGTSVSAVLMGRDSDNSDIGTWWGKMYGSYAGDGSDIPGGFIAGHTNPITGVVKGMLTSLFVGVDGNVGIITGDFDGQYHPDLGMWDADGSLTATEMASGFKGYATDFNYIDGYINGSFGDVGGYIYSDYGIYDSSYGTLQSYTTWLTDLSGNAEDWGIFNIELGGYYERP